MIKNQKIDVGDSMLINSGLKQGIPGRFSRLLTRFFILSALVLIFGCSTNTATTRKDIYDAKNFSIPKHTKIIVVPPFVTYESANEKSVDKEVKARRYELEAWIIEFTKKSLSGKGLLVAGSPVKPVIENTSSKEQNPSELTSVTTNFIRDTDVAKPFNRLQKYCDSEPKTAFLFQYLKIKSGNNETSELVGVPILAFSIRPLARQSTSYHRAALISCDAENLWKNGFFLRALPFSEKDEFKLEMSKLFNNMALKQGNK